MNAEGISCFVTLMGIPIKIWDPVYVVMCVQSPVFVITVMLNTKILYSLDKVYFPLLYVQITLLLVLIKQIIAQVSAILTNVLNHPLCKFIMRFCLQHISWFRKCLV